MYNNNSLTFDMSKDLEFVDWMISFEFEKFGKMTWSANFNKVQLFLYKIEERFAEFTFYFSSMS